MGFLKILASDKFWRSHVIVTSLTGSDSLTGETDLSFIGSDCSAESPAAASSRTEFTEVASELDFSLLAES
jgi:hypothetical protein